MKTTSLAIAVLVASAAGLAGFGTPVLAVPVEAAWTRAITATPLRLLPLGDSITWGEKSTSGAGYRGDLWDALTGAGHQVDFVGGEDSGSMPDPDHEGHRGWRIDQIAEVAIERLTTYRPNVVTVHLGTNDFLQNHEVSSAPARLGALIDQILTAAPETTVLVSSIVPTSRSDIQPLIAGYNAQIPGLVQARRDAGRHVAFVDMTNVTTADLDSDGVHPNDTGYRKMAANFTAGIRSVFEAGEVTDPVTVGSNPIKGQEAGRCVDVPNVSQPNATAVTLWDCNGGVNQSWTPTPAKELRVYGGKCLDVDGNGAADGATAQITDCDGGNEQRWSLRYDGTIVGVQSGKCLDAFAHGTANGTALVMWTCNGGSNQKWTRTVGPAPELVVPGLLVY